MWGRGGGPGGRRISRLAHGVNPGFTRQIPFSIFGARTGLRLTLLPFSVASFNSPLGASRIFRTRDASRPEIYLSIYPGKHSKLPREVRRDRLAPCCHVIRTLSVPAMVNHPSQTSPTENGKVTCRVNRGSARIFLRKEKKSRPHLAGRTRVRKVICRVMRRGDNPGLPGHAPGT